MALVRSTAWSASHRNGSRAVACAAEVHDPPGAHPPQELAIASSSSAPSATAEAAAVTGEKDAEEDNLEPAKDLVDWLCQAYSITEKRRVRGPLRRAQAALRAEDPGRGRLSLERDILPKLEVRWSGVGGRAVLCCVVLGGEVRRSVASLKLELLESLSEGLGWKVFARYPEELIHPYATEYWGILAAYLFTTGFSPDKISTLFSRHPCLFGHVVRSPDNLRRLFGWLRELGLGQGDVLRLVDRLPLLLQTDVEAVLKPRVGALVGLGLPLPKVVTAVKRQPELLGVDSEVVQLRVDYLEGLGLSRRDVCRLLASDPALFVMSPQDKFGPMVDFLRHELGCGDPLLRKLVRAGLLGRRVDTLRARADCWRQMGFSPDQLLRMLSSCPRLLLYPVQQPQYQAKLRYLTEVLLRPLSSLESFPQYISYSLEDRIKLRAAAAAQLAGQRIGLSELAKSDEAFCRGQGIAVEAYGKFVAAWEGRHGTAQHSTAGAPEEAAGAGAATLEGYCEGGSAAAAAEAAAAPGLAWQHGVGSAPAGEAAAAAASMDGSSSGPQQMRRGQQRRQQQQQ
ncbi:hypothetical protein N2152v2_003461 [Parachlorella kessleri]